MDSEKTDFPVWVFSNASTDVYKDNKPSQFKNRLAKPLDLKGNWEVALHSISYPNNFKNIKKPCKFSARFNTISKVVETLSQAIGDAEVRITVNDGYYNTIAEIHEAIEQGIKIGLDKWIKDNEGTMEIATSGHHLTRNQNKKEGEILSLQYPSLVYIPDTKEFYFDTRDFLGFQVDNFDGYYIWRALGFDPALEAIHTNVKNKFPPSLTLNFPSHFIYSSFVEASPVGNSIVPLVAQVSNLGQIGAYSFQEFIRPLYVKVVQNYISDIDIKILDILAEEASFSDGVVSLVLLFKRRS